uniref:Uncharacterized protein n=1 Tax=Sphaerodactylus townsendi TaxID=933632 RepID=A0ACB8ETC8_9SAUR
MHRLATIREILFLIKWLDFTPPPPPHQKNTNIMLRVRCDWRGGGSASLLALFSQAEMAQRATLFAPVWGSHVTYFPPALLAWKKRCSYSQGDVNIGRTNISECSEAQFGSGLWFGSRRGFSSPPHPGHQFPKLKWLQEDPVCLSVRICIFSPRHLATLTPENGVEGKAEPAPTSALVSQAKLGPGPLGSLGSLMLTAAFKKGQSLTSSLSQCYDQGAANVNSFLSFRTSP